MRRVRWLLLLFVGGGFGWCLGHGALDVKTKAYRDVGGDVRRPDGALTAIAAAHVNLSLLRRAVGLAHFTQHRSFAQKLNRNLRITPTDKRQLFAKLERVGHRAGDIRRYPTNFSRASALLQENRVTSLIDRVFGQLDFSGLEVDIKMLHATPKPQNPQEGALFDELKGEIFVTHDKIKLTKARDCQAHPVCLRKQIAALRASRLKVVLGHFFRRGYPQRGKRLFLELKVGGGLGRADVRKRPQELVSICRTLAEVEATVQMHAATPTARQRLRRSISFASFSYEALAHMGSQRCKGTQHATDYEYYWIWALRWTASWFARRPRLKEARWLTGLWFEPSLFGANSINHFNQLNEARAKMARKPLLLYISSYFFTYPTQIALLSSALEKSGGVGMKYVKGIIYDIKVED